jgi:hypothetical protein
MFNELFDYEDGKYSIQNLLPLSKVTKIIVSDKKIPAAIIVFKIGALLGM